MTQTALCADGLHDDCTGRCAKWVAAPDDEVIEVTDIGIRVRCACECHRG